jgi:acyl dehydratase
MATDSHFRKFDDALIEKLRERIGASTSPTKPQPFITVANVDAIRHWAQAIGDYNPLYLDRDYAKEGPFGHLIAPPSMLYAFDKRANGGVSGLPGIHGLMGGCEWEWARPIHELDELTADAWLAAVEEREGDFAGRQLKITSEVTFWDAQGDVVGVSRPYGFRMERDAGREKGKYKPKQMPYYSPQDLDAIWDQMVAEAPRGAQKRFYEDIAVGDELDQVVRGPITKSDFSVFTQGWGSQFVRAHGDWVRWVRRHPDGGIRNSFGVPEAAEAVHWDDTFAQLIGVPRAYDYGPQRISWMMTLLTNWMGDHGHLRRFGVQLRRPVLVGDTVWVRAAVLAKPAESAAEGAVDISLIATNQDQEMVAKGTAQVLLPLRGDS